MNQEIDYNDMNKFEEISKFYSMIIKDIKKEDPDATFMLYNQAAIEYMDSIDSLTDITALNAESAKSTALKKSRSASS